LHGYFPFSIELQPLRASARRAASTCGCRSPVKPAWKVCSTSDVFWARHRTPSASRRQVRLVILRTWCGCQGPSRPLWGHAGARMSRGYDGVLTRIPLPLNKHRSSRTAHRTYPAVNRKLQTVAVRARTAPAQPGRKPPSSAWIRLVRWTARCHLPYTGDDPVAGGGGLADPVTQPPAASSPGRPRDRLGIERGEAAWRHAGAAGRL